MYLDVLKKGDIPWYKGWQFNGHYNPFTGTKYRGLNLLWLNAVSAKYGYTDSRWYTFNEIMDKDGKYHPGQKWHLKKGSEGVEISRAPYYYNREENKYYTTKNYYKKMALLDDEQKQIFAQQCDQIFPKNGKGSIIYIFNASQIEGVPEQPILDTNQINDSLLDRIIENMGVNYKELPQDKAYYNMIEDSVVLPPKNAFDDEGSYYSTKLHELAHATGHETRLNRDMSGRFGSEEYALEELRADIGSAFLMANFGLQFDEKHIQNHLAYVQGWSDILERNPQCILEAIKDAEKIEEYIVENSKSNQLVFDMNMDDTWFDTGEYIINLHANESEETDGFSYSVYKDFTLVDGGMIDGTKLTEKVFGEWMENWQRQENGFNWKSAIKDDFDADDFYEQVDKKIDEKRRKMDQVFVKQTNTERNESEKSKAKGR